MQEQKRKRKFSPKVFQIVGVKSKEEPFVEYLGKQCKAYHRIRTKRGVEYTYHTRQFTGEIFNTWPAEF